MRPRSLAVWRTAMQKIESLFAVGHGVRFERHRGILESFAHKQNIAAIVLHN